MFSITVGKDSSVEHFSVAFKCAADPSAAFERESEVPSVTEGPSKALEHLLTRSSDILSGRYITSMVTKLDTSVVACLRERTVLSLLVKFLLWTVTRSPVYIFSGNSSVSFGY